VQPAGFHRSIRVAFVKLKTQGVKYCGQEKVQAGGASQAFLA
jgi:hypothetical protein